VLVDVIPTLSPKPVTHIVVSHIHVDHAFGWQALKHRWPNARTVTSRAFPATAAREVRLGGSIGRYNNQSLALQPTEVSRYPDPDIFVDADTALMIDRERFEFHHAPGETEDQLWLALPGRRAIFTADYYQGFLPNAGNGKRIMRHIDEWAAALREMAATGAATLMPMHGRAVLGEVEVAAALTLPADALQYLSDTTVTRLNAGEREDVIAATLEWPGRFADAPALSQQYNRPEDIARMVMLRSTGWWDDIPSHFPAIRFEDEAHEALQLAGGLAAVDARARALLSGNPRLAARLADWAYFGAPGDPVALRLTVDVYMARLAEQDMPVQEGLIYFDQAARARAQLQQSAATQNTTTTQH
jgi:alkyl sulfatase BDS1-like metallo-beta-lactamase superfamily hydrolase